MRPIIRKLVWTTAGLAAIALAAWFALNLYLNSSAARSRTAGALTQTLGQPVTVLALTSGPASTTLDVELPGPDEPLVTARIEANVTPLGLALGHQPTSITIHRPTVLLRLDASGHPLDPLPSAAGGTGPLPAVTVRDGTLRIQQAGRPAFRVAGIQANAVPSGSGATLTGNADDPAWGQWSLAGQWAGDHASLTLTTQNRVDVTLDKLRSVPGIPAAVFREVQCGGSAFGTIQLSADPAGPRWHLDLDCHTTRVALPTIDLVASEAAGRIVVDMQRVTLEHAVGRLAEGQVRFAVASMDFAPAEPVLQFDLAAEGLDIRKLPASWGLPKEIEGRMKGSANVTLTVKDRAVEPRGQGRGVIEGAKVAGFPAEIEVRLSGDGKALRFDTGNPTSAADPHLSPLSPRKVGVERGDRCGSAAMFALLTTATLFGQPLAPPAPKPPTYFTANLKLKEVDLAELLKRLEVATPVPLAGKVSVDVAAGLPTNALGKMNLYRLNGKFASADLKIGDLNLRDVAAEITLREGVLSLASLTAKIGSGAVRGSARIGLDPKADLTADLQLTAIPIDELLKAAPLLKDAAAGPVSGNLTLRIPYDKLANLQAAVASGILESPDFTLYGRKLAGLKLPLDLRDGVASVANADIKLFGGSVTGSARVPLLGDAAGEFRADLKEIDAGQLARELPSLPVRLGGKLSGSISGGLPGRVASKTLPITLDLTAPRLTVQGIPATRLKGNATYKPGEIRYDLRGETLGGSFDVEGTYPLPGAAPQPGKLGGALRITDFRLGRLARELDSSALAPLRGRLSLVVNYKFDEQGRPLGSGRLEIIDLAWGTGGRRSDVTAPVRLTADGLEIVDVAGDVAGGELRGQLRYAFHRTDRNYFALTLDRADAARLTEPLGLTGWSGPVTLAIRGSLTRGGLRGTGTVSAGRFVAADVPVGELRVPFDWEVGPNGGELNARDIGGIVGGGRLVGSVLYHWGSAGRLEGRLRFADVSVRQLSKGDGQASLGRATGRFDFNGQDVRSLNDVTGLLLARFGETSLSDAPLFQTLAPFLFPVGGFSTSFTSGELRARLATGAFRVERLALAGPSATLFADGRVALNGRLDLDVVARTKQIGADAGLFRLFNTRLPVVGPLPLTLIADVSRFLSNRTVRLRIGGTVASPQVQVNAAPLLTEEAVRFFLGSVDPLLREIPLQ